MPQGDLSRRAIPTRSSKENLFRSDLSPSGYLGANFESFPAPVSCAPREIDENSVGLKAHRRFLAPSHLAVLDDALASHPCAQRLGDKDVRRLV